MLIDHGYYSYRNDPGRDYIVGVASHNTVMVDGLSYRGCESRIDNFVTGPGYTLLRATHRNYPGIEHTRWLFHLRPDLVVVIDQLKPWSASMDIPQSGKKHSFEQLFHLAPDLGARVQASSADSTEVTITCQGSSGIMKLIQISRHGKRPSVRIAQGEEDPLLGWTSNRHAKLIPSPVTVSRQRGIDACFASLLDLSGERVGWQLNNSLETTGTLRLRWRYRESHRALVLDLINDKVRTSQVRQSPADVKLREDPG